jgi:hypothetical protein
MPWSQAICASLLLVIGVLAFVYGIRVMAGRAPLPWSPFLRRPPVAPSGPQPHETVVAAVLGLTIAMIGILGGIGLLIVSLL